ncbi:hypothetical protein NDU88_002346 [Pleurodeles waltl]|uniref:Uncharacterized protein n=1 Tax=Pleurodeles waltl TaxID=8319 RepID=A0AAV7MVF2_PLEWA|nr:hypothetical protein NDU88_002346 [Pleurodeles waltl]
MKNTFHSYRRSTCWPERSRISVPLEASLHSDPQGPRGLRTCCLGPNQYRKVTSVSSCSKLSRAAALLQIHAGDSVMSPRTSRQCVFPLVGTYLGGRAPVCRGNSDVVRP